MSISTVWLITFSLLCLHVSRICCLTTLGPAIDGGASGNNGNQFVSGAPNTDKIIFGLNCKKNDMDTTDLTFEFYVNQLDDAFTHAVDSEVNSAGDLVVYSTCFFIDREEFDNTYDVTEATCSNANSVSFTDIETPSADDTSYVARTKYNELAIDSSANTLDCGAQKDGTTIKVGVYCKRHLLFDYAFDIIFLASHDMSIDNCIATTFNTSDIIDVEKPPHISISRNSYVTFHAYKAADISDIPKTAESAEDMLATLVNLGDAIYLEACLRIKEVDDNTLDINNQFFEDGTSFIGITVHTCTARADVDNFDFHQTVEDMTAWPEIIASDGCGSGNKPIELFAQDMYIFKYTAESGPVTNHYLTSPNCVRTPPFPAVSFQTKFSNIPVATIYDCVPSYCRSTDPDCFGSMTGVPADTGYPSCTNRKKRETITVGEDYPEHISVKVNVIMPGSSNSSAMEGCFEKTAFIGLTSGIGVLLVMVLASAVFLSLKLREPLSDDPTDSMAGIQNKGYF